MKSSVEALEGNKVKVYVEVEEDEFEHDIDRAFRSIAKEIKLPGFRNGKVPRKVLEARIGIGPAREQALRDAVPEYLAKAVREHEVDLIAAPEVDITDGQEEGPVEFDATCEVRPVITVPGYGGLRVELPSIEVERRRPRRRPRVRAASAAGRSKTSTGRSRPATTSPSTSSRSAATKRCRASTSRTGPTRSARAGSPTTSTSSSTGASHGDELTFSATPKGTEEPADFTVKITAVQAMTPPDLTDDWVSENLGEFDTVEEWNESLTESLTRPSSSRPAKWSSARSTRR